MSGAADPVLRFLGVSKAYGAHPVLRAVDVDVPRGRTTVLLGASGCGKSTLVQLANGLLEPDGGTVEAFGAPLTRARHREVRLRTGYAVQSIGLFPHLTLRRNVDLLARLEGREDDWIEARLGRLCGHFDLDPGLLDRHPDEVSGGQQQRVGLVRAMFLEPELLLLDEPFSAVDPITRGNIHERFLELKRDTHTTALLVTHDLREAVLLGDLLVFLEAGVVARAGPVREVLDDPRSPFVAELLEAQLA